MSLLGSALDQAREAWEVPRDLVLGRYPAFVTGDREAYAYLADSIRRFPRQSELADMIERAGLDHVRYRNLTGGVAALHSAWRL